MKKTKRKQNPYARKILVQSKVNPEEMREFLKKAHQKTKGNVSELIRIAVLGMK